MRRFLPPLVRAPLTLAMTLAALSHIDQAHAVAQPQPLGLHIVVIEGEDGVNVIQQKTAVAPVVEVRDRNDQPVAGGTMPMTLGTGPSACTRIPETICFARRPANRRMEPTRRSVAEAARLIRTG